MKRIKMFMDPEDYDILEEQVNDFLASLMPEKVLDIQYQDCENACSVMVVYEDEPAIAAEDNNSTDWPSNLSWPSSTPTTFDDIYGGKR